MSERKTTEIKLRVSPDEKTSWQIEAEHQGIGLSELIRVSVNNICALKRSEVAQPASAGGLSVSMLDVDESQFQTPLMTVASDTRGEDSSVAQAVPTFGVTDVVAKPWTFEGRNSE